MAGCGRLGGAGVPIGAAATWCCVRRALHNGTCFVTDALKRRHSDFSDQIERAVPRWLDPATRDDAKSQLAEDILVGLVLDTAIRAVGPRYAKAAANRWSSKFGPRSIDAPLAEDGLTLAEVMPDPASLISMEERIDAKRDAKTQAIVAPLLKPAKVLPAAEPPAPTKSASALPLNDLMSDLRHAVDKGSSLTLRYEQVAALLSGKFVEWLAPLVNAELVALSNERIARA